MNLKIGITLVLIITTIVGTSIFQNCAKVNYQVRNNIVPMNNTSSVDTVNTGGGGGPIVTKRTTINPAFNSQTADMKVLIVVDDSFTMSQSQTRLSTAVDSLLNPLQGRNVDFKVVSTSGVPDNQIDYDLQTTPVSANTTKYTITNSIHNRHGILKSLQNFNPTQFTTLKNQIKSAILAVGTNGSNTEEGFCAAARQLFDTSANHFFESGDKAAVIFLTDEDDTSSYATCLSSYEKNINSQQVVYYNYTQKRARVDLEYQVNRDGLISWYPVKWSIPLSSQNNFVSGSNCSSTDLSAALAQMTSMGYITQNIGEISNLVESLVSQPS